MGVLKLFIIGPPNAGKGTLCKSIQAHYGVVHVSAGDLLRDEVSRQSVFGNQVSALIASGRMVPDEIMVELVIDFLLFHEEVSTKGVLLDGFPRTRSQALALLDRGLVFDAMIVLNVPDEDVIERSAGRRIDPVTKQSYHIKFAPPPPLIAPRCFIRPDDTPERLKRRLEIYHKQEQGLLAVFNDIKLPIDARKGIADVFNQFNFGLAEVLRENSMEGPLSAGARMALLRQQQLVGPRSKDIIDNVAERMRREEILLAETKAKSDAQKRKKREQQMREEQEEKERQQRENEMLAKARSDPQRRVHSIYGTAAASNL